MRVVKTNTIHGRTEKILIAAITAFIVFMITGCGNKTEIISEENSDNTVTVASVNGIIPLGIEEAEDNEQLGVFKIKEDTGFDTVDIDLTELSSTVIYSEVFNMTNSPANYIGKVIKVNGECATYYDEATDNTYYACLVQDTAACCAQGIEFSLAEDYASPDDFPKDGDMITVVGLFDKYEENGIEYSTLTNASLVG